MFRISTTRPSPRSVAPADALDLDHRVGHRPHDDLALSLDAIDREADRVEARPDHEHVQRPPRPLGNPEQPAEPDDREHAATIRRDLVVLDCPQRRRLHLDDFAHRRLRHGERPIPDGRDHRVGDRERQRQLDDEPGAMPRLGVERQRAVQLLNRGLDHRHPDAAAAGAVRLFARREPGRANQIQQRRVVEPPVGDGHAEAPRAPADRLRIDAAPVVGDFQHHGIPGGRGGQRQRPFFRLVRGPSLRRRLDPVADRVPHQVENGIHHPLDQVFVDLGFLPLEHQPHLRGRVLRQVADDERHAPEDFADGDEAHAHDPLAQVAQLALERRAVLVHRAPLDRRHEPLDAGQRVLEPRPADHQVADHPHQLVEPRQIHANVVRGGGRQLRQIGRVGYRVDDGHDGQLDGPGAIRPSADQAATVVVVEIAREPELEGDAAVENLRCGVQNRSALPEAGPDRIDVEAARVQLGGRRERHDPRGGDGRRGDWRRRSCRRVRRRQGRGRRDDRGNGTHRRADWRRRLVVASRRDHALEGLHTADERIHARLRQRRLAMPQRAEVTFHFVREHLRLAQLHHAGDALERMEGSGTARPGSPDRPPRRRPLPRASAAAAGRP